ncbi:transglutaminaseTgpA domain-containing protein [Chloroflexota bacterium]
MQYDKYSAIFRVFAFLAVSSSIVAVALSIRDPLLLAIGIPGLAAGHYYSWRRREFSIRRSLILLLFMVLTVVLGGEILQSGLSDRMLLSRYLIYGLVIGSFDLRQRRNIIASLILGGLLLVLVSELALSLWFLIFPVVFTLLSLIAVAVSRIEAETGQAELVGELKLSGIGKLWIGFALGTLLLSAVFFLLMPRLASNQVTQASWLPSRLDLGLGGLSMLPSKPSALIAPGILPSRADGGEGEYTTLGYTGSAGDEVVMHVRSRISSYWRGLTLDRYDGRGWLSTSAQVELLDESRREFILPDSRKFLPGDKAYWQAYYLLSDQPNAVFTGYHPGRIYLPRTVPTFSEAGTLYRALSPLPRLRPASLRLDSVDSGDIDNLLLPAVSEQTASLAEDIVQGAPTDYDKAARLEHFLITNYSYDLDVEPLPPELDAVDFFLFEQQRGYCSHFATAMAVMARQVDLPARVAGGYLPGYIDPLTGAHMVRAGDAHAWVEIHFRRHGWVAFDPTPRPDAAMGFATGRNLVYFGLEDFTGINFASLLSPLANNFTLGSITTPVWLWVIAPILAVSAILLTLLLGHRRGKAKPAIYSYSILEGEPRRGMLKLHRKMVALLVKKGLPSRQAYQPPYEYASLIYPRVQDAWETVEWITEATTQAAYDPRPFHQAIVSEARQKLSMLRRTLTSQPS